MNRQLSLKTVLSVTLKKTLSLMRVRAGIIYLYDKDRLLLAPAAHRGISMAHLHAVRRVSLGEGLSGAVAASREPLLISDVLGDPRTFGTPHALRGLRAYVGVPILSGRKVLGVFALLDRQWGRFTKEDGALLRDIAKRVGVAIENAGLYEDVRRELAARKQAEAALQESEERFRLIFENAAVGIAQVTFRGRILRANPALQEMLGYTGEELNRKRFPEISHSDDAKGVPHLIRAALAGNHSRVHLEKRYLHKNGRIIWADLNCALHRDAAGKLLFVIAVIENITGRKQAEKERAQSGQRYRELFENSGTGVIIVDKDGRYLMVNKIAAAKLGTPPEKVVGKSMLDLLPAATARKYLASNRRFIKRGGRRTYEDTFSLPAGERTFLIVDRCLKDENGRNFAIQSSSVDITDRKRTEEALRLSEDKYRRLHESIRDAFARVDMKGRFQEFNPAYEKLLGYSAEELRRLTYVDLTPKRWHALENRILRDQVLKRGSSEVYEKEYRRKDGTVFPVELRSYLIREPSGRPAGMWAIVRDITERKRIEQALREERDRAKQYLDIAGVILLVIDAGQRVAMINRKGQQVLGYSAGELVGRNWFDVLLPARDRESVRASFIKLMAGEIVGKGIFERAIVTKAGKERLIAWRNTLLKDERGNITGVLASGEDITDLRDTEKALSSLVKFQNEMLDSAAIWICMMDARAKVTFWNRAAEEVSGYSREEVIGHALVWRWIFPRPAQRADLLSRIKEIVRKGERLENIETPIRCKDGQRKVILWHASDLVDAKGNLTGGVILGRDITGRKRAEQALRESEERFRTLFREAPIGVAIVGPERRFLDANDTFLSMLGYSKKALLRKTVLDVTQPDDRPAVIRSMDDTIDGADPGYSAERRYVRKDRSILLGHITTRAVRGPEGKFLYAIGMIEDISARRQAEERLKTYQERLRSLASQLALTEERERRRLATALHDDIGQTLALARIKLSELADASPRKEFIARVRSVHEMIARMLARTRTLTFDLSPPVLYELGFGEAVGWLVEEFRKQHPLRWEFRGERLSPPLADDVRVTLFQGVRELLFNVVKHARAKTVSVRVECGPAEVRVRVEDDGIGFAADEFWSNPKAMTGFGLFSTRERLESLGGRLQTDSWPGGGARAMLAAPLASSGVPSKGD